MVSRLDIVTVNILGERGLRYKRNVLAISLIVTVLAWTGASLGSASLFGVSLSQSTNSEIIAWTIVEVILVYQFVMLVYYGWTDLVNWNFSVEENLKLPVLKIYFGNLKEGDIDHLHENNVVYKIYNVTKKSDSVQWSGKDIIEDSVRNYGDGLIHNRESAAIRRSLNAFILLEFGTPYLWCIYSLYAALYKILSRIAQMTL